VWKTRVIINPNRQPMETHFFERAGYFYSYNSLRKLRISLGLSYFLLSSQAALLTFKLHFRVYLLLYFV
jgi:hypothetical protein